MKRKFLSFLLTFALIFSCLAFPSVGAHAAQVSVYSAVSPDPSYQVFYINSDDMAHTRYDLYDGTSWSNGHQAVGEVHLPAGIDYDIFVYQVNDEGEPITDDARARSMLAHTYTVQYNLYDLSGNLVNTQTIETGTVGIDDSYVFTADTWIEDGGIEYDLSSDFDQVPIVYGQGTYAFNYTAYDPEPVEAYVYYVDDRGNVLDTKTLTLEYYGGDVTFNVDPHITVGGRDYTKLSGPDKVTVNYFSPVLDYDIIYVEDAPEIAYPYTVKINYIDSATGAVIGNQYEAITADDGAYDAVEFLVPDSLEVSSDGSVLYYHTDNTVVSHVPDGSVRSYDVPYSLFDEESPYYWNIKLVDSVTGNLLGEDYIEVGVDETVTYTPDVQVTAGGANYLLDSSMASSYERHYSDTSSRILYIYYNEEGSVVDSEQTLNISFRSVSDDVVLYAEEVTVPAGESYTLDIPETYTVDDTAYVVLAGQGSAVEHAYYSPQRNYTIYYRDVNDLQNVDTVVTREETVYYDNPVTVEEIVYVDEEVWTEPADEGVTVLANDTTGDVVTLDDEGTPLADNPDTNAEDNSDTVVLDDEDTPLASAPGVSGGNATDEVANDTDGSGDAANAGDTVTIDDETTPLAALPDNANGSGSSVNIPLVIGGAAVAAIVIIAAAGIVISRKRKNTK